MTEWIITSSVLIIIIAVLRFLLRGKISLKLQYALWGLVLMRLMLPFSVFESPSSVLNLLREKEEPSTPPVYYEPYAPGTINPGIPDGDIYILDDYVDQIAPGVDITLDDNGYVTEPEIKVIDWGGVLMGIWLTGTAVSGAVFAVSNLRFSKKLKKTREYASGTKAWLPVYESSAVKTPCLFGMFRPAIYVTKEVFEDRKVLSHVLEHETTHYRHGDHVWSVLRCFCLALHWYNPLVWLAAFLSMRDSELACDEDTIKRIGEEERIEYGRTLINLTCEKPSVGILSAATTMTGSKSSIKERIMLIAKKPKMLKITAALVALIAVFAVGCTFTGAVVYNPKTADVEVTESFSNRIEPELSGLDGVIRMTVTSASPEEITTKIYNKSSEEIRYSTGYTLHFEKDGKWYELDNIEETTDMIFSEVQTKFVSAEYESSWTNVSKESYGKLPDGKYRIIRTVSFGEMDISENEFYVIGAEFVLENGKLATEYLAELKKGEYIPAEQIFMNFASSFFGIPEEKYLITDDAFVILDSGTNAEIERYPVSEWKWQEFPYSEEEWKNLFIASEVIPFPDISEYRNRYYQPLDENYFIASLDGELWLVDISPKKMSAPDDLWVWSIYEIAPAEETESGKAYWEAAPALSSRSPWFEFEFDLDYSKITAKVSSETDEGSLYDIETTENINSIEIEKGENLRWVPHNWDFGFVLSATIDFEVYEGEKIAHSGSLEIRNTGSTNFGAMYEATLVSKTLSLRESSEFAGGHISLKTSEPGIDYDYYSGLTEYARNEFGIFSNYDNMAEFTFAVPDLSGKDFSEFPFVEENPEWCINGNHWIQQDGNFSQALFETAEAEEIAKAVALLNCHHACFGNGSESFGNIFEANKKELLWEAILRTPVRGRYPTGENHALTAILEAGSEAAGYEIYAVEVYSAKDVEKTFHWLFGEKANFVPMNIPAFGIRYFEEIGLFVQFFDVMMVAQDYPQILSYSEENGIYKAEVIMASALNEGFDEIGFGIKLADGSVEFLPITAENVRKAAEVETHYIYTFEKAADGHFVLLGFEKIPGVKTENPAEEPSGSNTEIEIGGRVFYLPEIEGAGLSYSDGRLTATYTKDTDFSNLFPLIYAEEIEYLEIYAENYAKVLVFPGFPNVKNLNIELGEKVKFLDISALDNLGQLTLCGEAEELFLPQNLESVSVYGQTDLSLFADCESIRNIEILGETNLEALKDFPNLETVYIHAVGCDLSPLNNASFSELTLSNLTDEELSAIDGCPIKTLQISDESISDLSVIERLPNLETLFFTVASGANPYVTTFMEPSAEDLDKLATPVDVSLLKEFLQNGGTLYLLTDPNR